MSGIGRLKLKGVGVVGAVKPATSSSSTARASVPSFESKPITGAKRGRSELDEGSGSSSAAAGGAGGASAPETAPRMTAATRSPGTGSIMSSGVTVMGSAGTRFKAELAVGDAIEVLHPRSGVPEVRVVKMVVGDASMGINAPFSSDLASPQSFHILKLPKAIKSAEEERADLAKRRADEERGATGRYGSGSDGRTYTYREQLSGGSYRVRTVALNGEKSREELLDMRAKLKSDKFC